MLNQEKTGRFIAETRRAKELTQRELADKLGMSDKTISKWETGHGMPDISVIPDLCRELSITSNELLAGEKLDNVESFNKKVEENIMELMKDNKKARDKSKWSLFGGLAGFVMLILYITCFGGLQYLTRFIDLPSLFCVAGITLLILVASGRFSAFITGIRIVVTQKAYDNMSDEESLRIKKDSLNAMKTAINANILGGVFGTITACVYMIGEMTSPDSFGPTVMVALITLVYGVIFALLLIPFRERLSV